MSGETELTYKEARQSDAPLLIKIYNAAFHDDFVRYGECPAYGRTISEMEDSVARFPKLIIMRGGVPAGVISYSLDTNGGCCLGCLCVLPEYQGQGIGTGAFRHLLEILPDWRSVSLITPADKVENLRFYTERCGCRATGRRMDGNVEVAELRRDKTD